MGSPYITDLLAIEDAVFVADILTKTRDGGLPWKRKAPDLYTITLCEQPDCQVPSQNPDTWVFYVGRNRANDGNLTYVYYLDVILTAEPYLSIDSRETNYVEQLFRTIELSQVNPSDWRIDQALEFISDVPTSPTSDVSNFVMCGGVEVDGSAVVFSDHTPNTQAVGGVIIGGTSPNSVIKYYPPGQPYGVQVDGAAITNASYKPAIDGVGTNLGGNAVPMVKYFAMSQASVMNTLTASALVIYPTWPIHPELVVAVEQDWIYVTSGYADEVVPQAYTSMYPDSTNPNANLHSFVSLNYWDWGPFGDGGGVQLVFYNTGDNQHDEEGAGSLFGPTVDTVTWTQRLEISGGNLTSKILNASSASLGDFSGLTITTTSPVSNFANYDPRVDKSYSAVFFGHPPDPYVQKFGLIGLRWYDASGLVAKDDAPFTFWDTTGLIIDGGVIL